MFDPDDNEVLQIEESIPKKELVDEEAFWDALGKEGY